MEAVNWCSGTLHCISYFGGTVSRATTMRWWCHASGDVAPCDSLEMHMSIINTKSPVLTLRGWICSEQSKFTGSRRNVNLLFWKFQTNYLFNLFVFSLPHRLREPWSRSTLGSAGGVASWRSAETQNHRWLLQSTKLPVESFQFQCWQICLNLLLTTEELKEQYVPALKAK